MKARVALAAVLLTCSVAAQNRGPLDLAKAPVAAGSRRIAYGADPLQFGELRLPSGPGPYPIAIVVHGGCWLSRLGTFDERMVAIDNMRPMAAALTEAGIATWNIEYRRVGNAGGGWPGTFRDVANAADFVRTLARDYHLDLKRVVAIGHSSGGHLALWLAARRNVPRTSDVYTPDPLSLAGVVDLDGPADLKAVIPLQQGICGGPVVTELMGGSPEEHPDRYRAASPSELLPLGVAEERFGGQMTASHVTAYDAAAKAAGDAVHTTVLPDAGHFAFIDPQSEVWPQVLKSVQRLLAADR